MLEQTNELGKLISGKEKKTLSLMDNSKAIKESQSPPSTHIIAVTSGKGGVGKSTLCVNLGISLANMGFKVLLLDGDLGLANLNVLMGIIPDHSLYDVIRGKKKLSDIIISTSFGLDIIAGANGISQLADISQSQRELLVRQLADLNGYDIMLIDTGAGINANVISLALASDEILVITTPEPTSITDAYAMIKSIVVHDPQRTVRLLINRAPSALEAKRAADRLKSITSRFLSASVDILGFVFEEEVVQKSVRSQRPLMVVYPGAKSSACVSHIGAQLTNLTEQTQPKGIRVFFQNFLGKKSKQEAGVF